MIKFAEQIVVNDEFEMIMNKEAIEILSDLTNPVEINSTKKALFNLMYGITEHLAALYRLVDADTKDMDGYTSTSLKENLYMLPKFYELIDNIEFKKKGKHEKN